MSEVLSPKESVSTGGASLASGMLTPAHTPTSSVRAPTGGQES